MKDQHYELKMYGRKQFKYTNCKSSFELPPHRKSNKKKSQRNNNTRVTKTRIRVSNHKFLSQPKLGFQRIFMTTLKPNLQKKGIEKNNPKKIIEMHA